MKLFLTVEFLTFQTGQTALQLQMLFPRRFPKDGI